MLIFGYPSTGKTFFTERERKLGHYVLESDEYIRNQWPEYFDNKLYENEIDRLMAHRMIEDYVKRTYKKYKQKKDTHFVSNILTTFTTQNNKRNDHERSTWDIGFWHDKFDPDEREIAKKKWNPEFIKKLAEWNAHDKTDVKKGSLVDKRVVLPKGKHITNYI